MSSDVVIRAEGLGKKYIIGHQAERERYTTLRDSMGRSLRNWGRSARDMFAGKALVAGDETEEFWALKDINFEIKRGDVVGIIGRNGAGKSTLLKVLSRITEPTTGRVTIDGRVASLLEVGTGFHPELSGRENIYLNGAILGMSRDEIKRKFDEIVDFAGVEKFLDTPVKRYSSGMYVRLAFAVAAHLEPEILIVDEVLAVGDADFQKKCLGKMKDVAGHGRTVLFVSHNMAAVRSLCSSCALLSMGSLINYGLVDQVSEKYLYSINREANHRFQSETISNLQSKFKSIELSVIGEQPDIILQFDITVHTGIVTQPSFIAIDFVSSLGVPLMQALPSSVPFINGEIGDNHIQIKVMLPPLIPSIYSVSFWMGSHNSCTIDFVADAISFEVQETPTPNRTFPHTLDHGSIVPKSSYILL